MLLQQRGQALVETVIVSTILVLVVIFMTALLWAIFVHNKLDHLLYEHLLCVQSRPAQISRPLQCQNEFQRIIKDLPPWIKITKFFTYISAKSVKGQIRASVLSIYNFQIVKDVPLIQDL